MEQRHTFLAFDCGATSGRGILATFGPDGFRMEEVCRFPNQILELGGKYYWNVYSIYEEFLKCLTDLGRKGIEINSIGIDTWGVDFGCIAPDGSLYPCEHCPPEARYGDISHGVTDEAARKAFCSVGKTREKCRNCVFLPECTSFSNCPIQDTHCKVVRRMVEMVMLNGLLERKTDPEETAAQGSIC